MTPVAVKGNYSVNFEFTRRNGNEAVNLILPIGTHSTSVVLSGWSGTVSGMVVLEGRSLDRLPASTGAVTRPGTLQNGKRHRVQVNVVHRTEYVR